MLIKLASELGAQHGKSKVADDINWPGFLLPLTSIDGARRVDCSLSHGTSARCISTLQVARPMPPHGLMLRIDPLELRNACSLRVARVFVYSYYIISFPPILRQQLCMVLKMRYAF